MTNTEQYPPIVQEIAEMIGIVAALRVVTLYGGRQVRFSSLRHDLAANVGAEESRKLVFRFGQTPVYVPKCMALIREARNKAIRARFDELTRSISARRAVAMLADEFMVADRTIWMILSVPDGYQPDKKP